MHRKEWQPDSNLWERLKPLARQMRKEPTVAEQKLWQHLRRHHIAGVKFRRQYAIERFIVDFCSDEARLVIEVDGPTHQYTAQQDAIRQQYLEAAGFVVLRFTNLEVLNNIHAVADRIDQVLREIAARRNNTPP